MYSSSNGSSSKPCLASIIFFFFFVQVGLGLNFDFDFDLSRFMNTRGGVCTSYLRNDVLYLYNNYGYIRADNRFRSFAFVPVFANIKHSAFNIQHSTFNINVQHSTSSFSESRFVHMFSNEDEPSLA